jgi:hypothetical protein
MISLISTNETYQNICCKCYAFIYRIIDAEDRLCKCSNICKHPFASCYISAIGIAKDFPLHANSMFVLIRILSSFFNIYSSRILCLSSCLSYSCLSSCLSSCHSCRTLTYSLCFSNQTDQGDETEGLEMEGLEMER